MTQMLEGLIKIFGDSILEFQDIFLPFGGSLFILFIVIEILREAIDISSGKGVDLGRKLILILCVGTILLNFNGLSKGIYSGAMNAGKDILPRFEDVNNWINEGYESGVEDQRASMELDRSSGGGLTSFFLYIVMAVLSGLGLLLIYIAMIFILVFIAGAYASLALTLVMGPVFIAMFVSPELRGTGVKWTVILLSVFLMIPAYIMILKITASLYSGSMNINTGIPENFSSRSMTNTIDSIGMLMVNPLLTFGLIFSVSKIVGSITGSAGNIAEKAAGIAATAAAATVMVVKGGLKALQGRSDLQGGLENIDEQSDTESSENEKPENKSGSNGNSDIPDANPRESSSENSENDSSIENRGNNIPDPNPPEEIHGQNMNGGKNE